MQRRGSEYRPSSLLRKTSKLAMDAPKHKLAFQGLQAPSLRLRSPPEETLSILWPWITPVLKDAPGACPAFSLRGMKLPRHRTLRRFSDAACASKPFPNRHDCLDRARGSCTCPCPQSAQTRLSLALAPYFSSPLTFQHTLYDEKARSQ